VGVPNAGIFGFQQFQRALLHLAATLIQRTRLFRRQSLEFSAETNLMLHLLGIGLLFPQFVIGGEGEREILDLGPFFIELMEEGGLAKHSLIHQLAVQFLIPIRSLLPFGKEYRLFCICRK